jgi:hypothetical protein
VKHRRNHDVLSHGLSIDPAADKQSKE